jgi:hypothetical protein
MTLREFVPSFGHVRLPWLPLISTRSLPSASICTQKPEKSTNHELAQATYLASDDDAFI